MNEDKSKINPFVTGQPAKGKDFFGRETIFYRIDKFLNNNNIHFLIQGKRRTGKTSILKNIQQRFKKNNYAFIYFNVQDKNFNESSVFLKQFIKNLTSKLKITPDFDVNSQTIERDFSDLILKSLAKSQFEKVIFLLDEFDIVYSETYSSRFAELLSEYTEMFSASGVKIKFIYASGMNYFNNFQVKQKLFNEKSEKINISNLDYNSISDLIKLSEDIIPFEEESVKAIYGYTAGNPFFTQCLAYRSFDYALVLNSKTVTPKIVRRQFLPSVKSYGSAASSIWSELRDYDKLLLFAASHVLEYDDFIDALNIIKKANEFNILLNKNIKPELNILKRNNFLKPVGINRYVFESEFFRKWICLFVKRKELPANDISI